MDWVLAVESDNMLIFVAVCGWLILRWEWDGNFQCCLPWSTCKSRTQCHQDLLAVTCHLRQTYYVTQWQRLHSPERPPCLHIFICLQPEAERPRIGNENSNILVNRIAGLNPRPSHVTSQCRAAWIIFYHPRTQWNINSVLIGLEKFCSHGWWQILRFPLYT